jgi:hypothetical protein
VTAQVLDGKAAATQIRAAQIRADLTRRLEPLLPSCQF